MVCLQGREPHTSTQTVKKSIRVFKSVITALGAIVIAGTSAAQAGPTDWIFEKRFGSGKWSLHEMNRLAKENIRMDASIKCEEPDGNGGYLCPTDDKSMAKMYKDVDLAKELNKAYSEAYQERVKHNQARRYGLDENNIRTWEGMTDQQYEWAHDWTKGRERIASYGAPKTQHGFHAMTTDSKVTFSQNMRLCGREEGSGNQEQIVDDLVECKETVDGSTMVVTENSVSYKDGQGRSEITFSRELGQSSGHFEKNTIKNEGDIYNIDNQDDGEVNVHARGSKVNAGAPSLN